MRMLQRDICSEDQGSTREESQMPIEGDRLCWCARCVLLRRWLAEEAEMRRRHPCTHVAIWQAQVGELRYCPLCVDMDINIGPCLEKR